MIPVSHLRIWWEGDGASQWLTAMLIAFGIYLIIDILLISTATVTFSLYILSISVFLGSTVLVDLVVRRLLCYFDTEHEVNTLIPRGHPLDLLFVLWGNDYLLPAAMALSFMVTIHLSVVYLTSIGLSVVFIVLLTLLIALFGTLITGIIWVAIHIQLDRVRPGGETV